MKIPAQFQYRVLFWGIVGAIVLRGAMIAMGAALIHAFDWTFYLFGAILLYSAARMLKQRGRAVRSEQERAGAPRAARLSGAPTSWTASASSRTWTARAPRRRCS